MNNRPELGIRGPRGNVGEAMAVTGRDQGNLAELTYHSGITLQGCNRSLTEVLAGAGGLDRIRTKAAAGGLLRPLRVSA